MLRSAAANANMLGSDSDSSSDYGDEEVMDFLEEVDDVVEVVEEEVEGSGDVGDSHVSEEGRLSHGAKEMGGGANDEDEAKESTGFLLDSESLRQTTFFSQFQPEHQKALFEKLIQVEFEGREDIVTEGMPGDCFYVIIKGEAQILKNERNMAGATAERNELRKSYSQPELKVLTHIYRGDSFGELALLYGSVRDATVRTVCPTTCLMLRKADFDLCVDVKLFLIMQKVPLFTDLSREEQLKILPNLIPAEYNDGDYVVRQGEEGDRFYILMKGQAVVTETKLIKEENEEEGKGEGGHEEVEHEDSRGGTGLKARATASAAAAACSSATTKSAGTTEKVLTNLYPGHFFGEMALLQSQPRMANVIAKGKLKCMTLTKKVFKIILQSSKVGKMVQKNVNQRKEIRDIRSQSGTANPLMKLLQRLRKYRSDAGSEPKVSRSLKKSMAGKHQRINDYVVLDELGQGSYGKVELWVHEKSGTQYAVKIINRSLNKRRRRMRRRLMSSKEKELRTKVSEEDDFYSEIAVLKKLNHPNVVKLHEVIDDPNADKMYIVQEYCDAGSLMDGSERCEPLVQEDARILFRRILRGVEYLHFENVIHRDIKPENLLATSRGEVKISDFGVSRIVSGTQQKMQTARGTPAFMAPELLAGNVYTGPPVDVWSLGATLYMLVVGTPPWMAKNEIELARKVQNDELTFPETAYHGEHKLDPHVINLLTRMLEKNPRKRISLYEVMEHEFVTKEGSAPMPKIDYATVTPRRSSLTKQDISTAVQRMASNSVTSTISSASGATRGSSIGSSTLRSASGGGGGGSLSRGVSDPSRPNSAPSPKQRTRALSDTLVTKVKHLGKQIFGFSFGGEQSSSDGNREVDTNGDRLTSKALSGAKALLNRSSAGRTDGGITEGATDAIKRTDSMHRRGVSLPPTKMSSLPGGKMFDLAKLQPLPFDFEGNYGDKARSKAFIQQRIRAMRKAQRSFKGSFFVANKSSSSSFDTGYGSEPNSPGSRSSESESSGSRTFCASPARVERVTLDLLLRQHMEQETDRISGTGMLGRKTKSFAMKRNTSLALDTTRSFSTNTDGVSTLLRRASTVGVIDSNILAQDVKDKAFDSDDDSDDDLGDIGADEIVAFDEDDLVSEKPAADEHAPDPELQPFTAAESAGLAERFRHAMGKDEKQRPFRASRASSKGLRRSMEDRSVIVEEKSLGFCAVYDGHNGSNIAEYAGKNLHLLLWNELEKGNGDIVESVKETCLRIDEIMYLEHTKSSQSNSAFLSSATLKSMSSSPSKSANQSVNSETSESLTKTKLLRTKNDNHFKGFSTNGTDTTEDSVLVVESGSGGATAAIVVVEAGVKGEGEGQVAKEGEAKAQITVSWVGDSAVVLSTGGKALKLTRDHKCSDDSEAARIKAAGGMVDKSGRLNRDLMVSRSLGDFEHKAFSEVKNEEGAGDGTTAASVVEVAAAAAAAATTTTTTTGRALINSGPLIAEPEAVQRTISALDSFLIIASDGVWDVLTPQEACDFVMRRALAMADAAPVDSSSGDEEGSASTVPASSAKSDLKDNEIEGEEQDGLCEMVVARVKGEDPGLDDTPLFLRRLADALVHKALARGSLDNVSVVLVDLSSLG